MENAKQLRGADEQHHRPQDRDADGEQHGAEDAAHQRGHVGRAQRAAGLAPFRHRIAVEHGRSRGGAAWHAEQHRRDRIAGGRGGAEPEQQREGGVGIHVEGERQEHRRAGQPADAGNDAEHQPHDAAEPEEHQAMRLHQQQEGLARRAGHEGELTREAFHLSALRIIHHARTCDRLRSGARSIRLGSDHEKRKRCAHAQPHRPSPGARGRPFPFFCLSCKQKSR